jgi:TPR repeat protein
MRCLRMLIFLSIVLLNGLQGFTAEISGRVVAVDGKTVTIALDAAAAPSADDKVEIFVIIEDLGEEALVAEQGHPEAQTQMGYMAAEGIGVQADLSVARGWFELAAEQGSASGQVNLGIMYLVGNGVPKDRTAALKWLLKAAEQGQEEARRRLEELGVQP